MFLILEENGFSPCFCLRIPGMPRPEGCDGDADQGRKFERAESSLVNLKHIFLNTNDFLLFQSGDLINRE